MDKKHPTALPFKFLFSAIIIYTLFSTACNRYSQKSHPEYFDNIISHSSLLIDSGYATRAFAFLDSAYGAFPDASTRDLYRQYELKESYYGDSPKNYNKALVYADSMLLTMVNDPEEYAHDYINALSAKGNILFEQNRYTDAFICFYKAKTLAEKYSDSYSNSILSNSLGIMLYRQQKYGDAITYFKKAYNEGSQCDTNDIKKYFTRRQNYLDNIALCYEHLNKSDSAIIYYYNTLDFINENERKFPEQHKYIQLARAVVYGNLGGTLVERGAVKEAEPLLKESVEINSQKGYDAHDAQYTGIKLANLYLITGRYANAFQVMQQVRRSLDSLPIDEAELRWRQLTWKYYDTIGNKPLAYSSYKNYINYKDSFDAKRKDLASADFNKIFQNLSQQYEITILKKNNNLETAYLILAVAISLMAVIILYLIWTNFRSSKENVVKLTALNTHIKDQNVAIQQQAGGLKELNTFKDKILTIISHDLRGPVGSLTALMSILEEDLPPDELVIVKEGIAKQLQSVNELVDSLLRWAANSFYKDVQETGPLNIHEIAEQNIDLFHNIADSKHIHIENNIPSQVQAMANYDQVNIVIRNLIANSVKFTGANGRITLAAADKGETIEISIADTGVGMTKEQLKKLFTHAHNTTYGTKGEKGTGLGLLLCKEYIENNKGSISVTSEPDKGSTFIITLPKAPEA